MVYTDATHETHHLLLECRKRGYTTVSIGMSVCDDIEAWPQTDEQNGITEEGRGWPGIWEAIDVVFGENRLTLGCGNDHSWIEPDLMTKLTRGRYYINESGHWDCI